jgi:5-formyltetrahydrofolate cyclo-ligase
MAEQPVDVRLLKGQLRKRAQANRRRQKDKERLSREICHKLAALPEYAGAATVMFYVDFRNEVRTRWFLPTAWQQGKRLVVPYCAAARLELFRLESIDELAPGIFRILEPKVELRGLAERKVDVSTVDLIVVPGVAFDREGGRLGHGKGYYDRLLRLVRPDTTLVALAFECQLFPAVPTQRHDVRMDKVITEKAIYERSQPR